ncbi:hypothetical protein BDR03DRAFT_321967 [Suillus americanus]|nr:hypothetical protein BDR03DRAFT_321967 [Suillus americanus]
MLQVIYIALCGVQIVTASGTFRRINCHPFPLLHGLPQVCLGETAKLQQKLMFSFCARIPPSYTDQQIDSKSSASCNYHIYRSDDGQDTDAMELSIVNL